MLARHCFVLILALATGWAWGLSAPSRAEPQPRLSYAASGCIDALRLPPSATATACETAAGAPAWLNLQVSTTAPGEIHFRYQLPFNCCGTLVLDSTLREGDILAIVATNTGNSCRCMCPYDLSGRLTNLPAGTYRLQIYEARDRDDPAPLVLLWEQPLRVE